MTKKDLKDAIPLILKNVSFINYLIYNDYRINNNLSNGSHMVLEAINPNDQSVIETIVLVKNNNTLKYKSLTRKDKGDIIDFVSNRITNRHVNSKSINLIEACKRLIIFQGLSSNLGEDNYSIKDKNIKEFQEFFFNIYSQLFELKPNDESHFLSSAGVTLETVKKEPFQNTVFEGLNPMGDTKGNYDTAFILRDENNNETGIIYYCFNKFYQNYENKSYYFAPFSDLKQSIWISHTEFNNVCLVQDPLEAFCFQELNPDDKYTYMAPPPGIKSLSVQHIEYLYKYIDEGNRVITLGTNDSIEGHIFDLQFICRYTYENNNLLVVDKEASHVEILYKAQSKEEQKILIELFSQIQKKNLAVKNLINEFTTGNINFYLNNELIKIDINRTKQHLIKIFIPKRNNQLFWFNKLLIRTHSLNKIKFKKPEKESWYFTLLKEKDLLEKSDNIFDSSKISS